MASADHAGDDAERGARDVRHDAIVQPLGCLYMHVHSYIYCERLRPRAHTYTSCTHARLLRVCLLPSMLCVYAACTQMEKQIRQKTARTRAFSWFLIQLIAAPSRFQAGSQIMRSWRSM